MQVTWDIMYQKYTKVFKNMQKYTKVCKGMQNYAKLDKVAPLMTPPPSGKSAPLQNPLVFVTK